MSTSRSIPLRHRANEPNDLERLFVERANAGDVDGLVALYEPDALVYADDGRSIEGADQIRAFFVDYLQSAGQFAPSIQRTALSSGELALTSSRHSDGTLSVEIARRQADGSWLWVVDRFAV